MSLIYDALKEQAGPATTGRARTRASWWAEQPARARTSMLLAGLLVLVVPLTYFVTSALKHHTVPPQQAMATNSLQAPVVRAATKVMPPADVPVREPVLAETSIPAPLATISAPEPAVLPGSATDTAMEPRVAEPATTATPAPAAITAVTSDTKVASPAPAPAPAPISIKVERRTSAGSPARSEADDGQVARTVENIESAMANGDLSAARQALAQLDTQLPEESLTLLRMQAWIAHAGNDAGNAEKLYRRIVERVPDDINAGVNIALLDARRGDADAARRRLIRLSGRYPRSPQVARALADLDNTAP